MTANFNMLQLAADSAHRLAKAAMDAAARAVLADQPNAVQLAIRACTLLKRAEHLRKRAEQGADV